MSKLTVKLAILVLVAGFGMSAFSASASAQTGAGLWACDWSGNLYNVNTSNASLTFIGSTGVGLLGALEFGPNGTLYGINSAGGSGSSLYAIDPNTAAATFIGSLGYDGMLEGGLTFSPGGVAYAVEHFNGTSSLNDLVTVDLNTGAATNVATIGTSYHDINGLVWRSDGMLVGLADDAAGGLATIDPGTGAFSTIAPLTFSVGAIGGMTTDYSSGTNYLGTGIVNGADLFPGTNSLYTFDAFTGATSYVGMFSGYNDPDGISGLAYANATTVPEPATMGLFGLGLAGLGFIRRRRKS
jgi:hypothetical protein